jgi:hypothetical protein
MPAMRRRENRAGCAFADLEHDVLLVRAYAPEDGGGVRGMVYRGDPTGSRIRDELRRLDSRRSSLDDPTRRELVAELGRLEDSIGSLRYERSKITYTLEQELKEADRIKRHLRRCYSGPRETEDV